MSPNTISRRSLLRGLAGVTAGVSLLATRLAFAQAAAPAITSTRLADRVYLLMGDGGNVAVITSPDGLFMIDSGLPDRAADLAAAVTQVSRKPVLQLFDTHWHTDHTGSNVLLGQKGVKIVAHDNVRLRLSTRQNMEAFKRVVEPLPAAGIPGVTFHEPGSITFGADTMQYTPVAPAHTDGDTFVFISSANVLHAGDLFFNGFYPFIDYSSLGWLGGMVAAQAKMLTIGDAQTKIIPGHGPLGNRADLKASHDMMETVLTRLDSMAKSGKTVDEVVAAAPTKDLDAQWGKGMMQPEMFTRVAYTGILRHQQAA